MSENSSDTGRRNSPEQQTKVEHHYHEGDGRNTPFMMIACILAGFALGTSLCFAVLTSKYINKVEVLTIQQEGMKTAMIVHGIDPHPHMKGEPE